MLRLFPLALLSSLCLAASTQPSPRGIPDPIVPLNFGVNIHFVEPKEEEVDAIARIGYRFIRMDFSWGGTERKKGEYDFSGYDKLVEAMSKRDIRCLFILDYGNRLYDNELSPATDDSRAAFAKWAAAAAKHYVGKGIIWEIWNEPNIFFWKPKPNARDYCKLALATIDAVRAADPEAFIIGPASSEFPWAFFDVMAEEGVFAKLDAVSVHPYRQKPPETAEEDYNRLKLLLARACPGKKLPIISGEWGYSTAWGKMTEELQAQYLARQWLTNLANDVNVSIWYDWKDDGDNPKDPEHHFGSVYRDLKEKPAAKAAKVLTETLRGYRFTCRIALAEADNYVLVFGPKTVSDGRVERRQALAVWTTGDPHSIQLPIPPADITVVGMMGDQRTIKATQKGAEIELQRSPQYLLLPSAVETGRGAMWLAPTQSTYVIRAGDTASIAMLDSYRQVPALRGAATVHVAADGKDLACVPWEDCSSLPIRVRDRSGQIIPATIEVVLHGQSNPLRVARINLIVSNSLSVRMLPSANETLTLLVGNPSGEAILGTMMIRVGDAAAFDRVVSVNRGQQKAMIQALLPEGSAGKAIEVRAMDSDGNALFRAAPTRWVSLSFGAGDWSARTEGDAKVAGAAKVTLVDAPAGMPQPGLAKALQIDYRFGPGWRYALIAPPPALGKIEGQPKAVSMWVDGDATGNALRCRFKDSTGQVFQASYGAIDWTGWRWITMNLDSSAFHWAGADDGVIHYPIQWDSPIVIDSAKTKTDQDLRLTFAGVALQYLHLGGMPTPGAVDSFCRWGLFAGRGHAGRQ